VYYICTQSSTKLAMDKHTKNKIIYNTEILNELIKKYGFKKNYIQKSIRGERNGTIPLKIQEEYKLLVSAANSAVKSKLEDI